MKNTTKKREKDYNDNHTFNTNKFSVMRPMIVSNNKLNVANKLNIVQQKKVVVMALYYLGLSSRWHVSVSVIPWELAFMNQR